MASIAGQPPGLLPLARGPHHHPRALLPPFDPRASPSARAIHRNSTAPGPGHWCRRQLSGIPGLGGRRHSQDWCHRGRAHTSPGWTPNGGVDASRHVLREPRNCTRDAVACTLPLTGRGAACVRSSLHCRSSASSCSRPSWYDRRLPESYPTGFWRRTILLEFVPFSLFVTPQQLAVFVNF
jgi:hypothetical protein